VKTLQLGLLVGAAVFGGRLLAFGQVDVNHQDGQTVFSIAIQPGLPFGVSAAFACPGEEACRPGVVRVVFGTFTRKKPTYKNDHSVSMVIDGETRLSIPNTQYAVRQAAANQVYENVVCMVLIDDFLALANAKKAEYEIGSGKGELWDNQLKALAALAERMPNPPEPSPALPRAVRQPGRQPPMPPPSAMGVNLLAQLHSKPQTCLQGLACWRWAGS